MLSCPPYLTPEGWAEIRRLRVRETLDTISAACDAGDAPAAVAAARELRRLDPEAGLRLFAAVADELAATLHAPDCPNHPDHRPEE